VKKRVTYRVKLAGCSDEWHFESKKKKKAIKWLKRLLKVEKISGYKYSGRIFKVTEQPLARMKNY